MQFTWLLLVVGSSDAEDCSLFSQLETIDFICPDLKYDITDMHGNKKILFSKKNQL